MRENGVFWGRGIATQPGLRPTPQNTSHLLIYAPFTSHLRLALLFPPALPHGIMPHLVNSWCGGGCWVTWCERATLSRWRLREVFAVQQKAMWVSTAPPLKAQPAPAPATCLRPAAPLALPPLWLHFSGASNSCPAKRRSFGRSGRPARCGLGPTSCRDCMQWQPWSRTGPALVLGGPAWRGPGRAAWYHGRPRVARAARSGARDLLTPPCALCPPPAACSS